MTEGIEIVVSLPRLPARKADAHKGDFGRVLVVGGSRGMIGAPALAALAALRGGAGLVTLAAPETIQLHAAGLCPCATSVPLSCDRDGRLAAGCVRELIEAVDKADVLAVGPGLGVGRAQQDLVLAAVEQEKPLVLDADGLNNIAGLDHWPRRRMCPIVLTPHPGELARLVGRPVAEIQADRQAVALAEARTWAQAAAQPRPLVLLLKGHGTIVTDGRRLRVNATGNPGMATGGAGDVLTGLVAALLAQGLEPLDAAALAAHVHGRAGDLAAAELSQPGMIATDLLDRLPQAIRETL
jgi:ADP-dependent NAD(P)H-hydrate dehydratase